MTTNYLVDTQNPTGYAQVVDELQNGSVTKTYSYGLERISQNWQPTTGNWQLSFYGYDGHGSVRQLTNSTGAVTDTYDYDAFGNLISSTGSTPNNYLFAGEQFDPALNLYYNRARYYNSPTGRFWSMDTHPELPSDPATIHRYLYVRANPVNRLDHRGLQDEIEEVAAEADNEVLQSMSVPGNGAQTIESIGNELSAVTQTESETVADAELEASAESTTESTQGEWVEEDISNPRAAQYQAQITGQPGQAYELNGVSFDGINDTGQLLEAKGPGYANLLRQNFADSVMNKLLDQASRQVAAAAGRQIVWHFAEQAAADAFSQAIAEYGIEGITVVVTP